VGCRAPLSTPACVATFATALALLTLLASAPPAAAQAAAADASVSGLAEAAGLRPSGVRALQRRLAQRGYLAENAINGRYGEQTYAAVIAFQKWELLPRDGIAGPITRAALAKAKRPRPRTRGRGAWVEILLDRQVLLLVRDGEVERVSHVSTGRRGFRTPPGEYAVHLKSRRAWSKQYKVWLPWASFFNRGIAIHQSAVVPTRPISHGCVRVTRFDAAWLFRRTPLGMRVRVVART
jgi:lipoprotein-anchoring transpeptidase ErfK/SrfK